LKTIKVENACHRPYAYHLSTQQTCKAPVSARILHDLKKLIDIEILLESFLSNHNQKMVDNR